MNFKSQIGRLGVKNTNIRAKFYSKTTKRGLKHWFSSYYLTNSGPRSVNEVLFGSFYYDIAENMNFKSQIERLGVENTNIRAKFYSKNTKKGL